MANSGLPAKPRPDFPLTPHRSGKWTKKIRGRHYYFGRWEDPDAAEREYDRVKLDLRAGRSPVAAVDPGTLTVRELFEMFLERRLERVDSGGYQPRSYHDLRTALNNFARLVGPGRLVEDLRPADFANARTEAGKRFGPHALNRYITNVRTAFRWASNNGILPRAVAFGDEFNKAPIAAKRRAMREKSYLHGKKLFAPAEVQAVVAAADAPLRAMILLAVNCGFLAADLASLHRAALDLNGAWLEFPRTKTEVMRMAPLWPETVTALREALKVRPKARNGVDDGLVFLTKYGNRWVHDTITRNESGITKVSRCDAISHAFTALLKTVKVKRRPIQRKGVGFSALRTTFRTVADEAGDQKAALVMMGHAFPGMDEWYVREIARPRLEKVAEHVRRRLLKAK